MRETKQKDSCSISHNEIDGIPVVSLKGLCGRILVSAARSIIGSLLEENSKTVIVDIGGVRFSSDYSYQMVNRMCADMANIGGRLVLIGTTDKVAATLRDMPLSEGCVTTEKTVEAGLIVAKRLAV
jgi:anti-anti-sigma regulatory factor